MNKVIRIIENSDILAPLFAMIIMVGVPAILGMIGASVYYLFGGCGFFDQTFAEIVGMSGVIGFCIIFFLGLCTL